MFRMAFYAYVKQRGGCDYTIACGQKLTRLEALTLEAARKEAQEMYENYGPEDGLKNIEIIEGRVVETIDLKAVQLERERAEKEREETREKERERAEYERLKAKFGDK